MLHHSPSEHDITTMTGETNNNRTNNNNNSHNDDDDDKRRRSLKAGRRSLSSSCSLRSRPGSTHNNLRDASKKSRLHLMAVKGFDKEHEMTRLQRVYKFIRLPNFSEYFMSVDHHQIWRRHLAWSLRDGDHLRNAVTSRFASNMVFMSLLLGTEIGVLFSPSKPADRFRAALQNQSYGDTNFWAAIVLCVSIGLTLSTLVANFTAWAIIGAVAPQNSHAILRSSVGLDAAQLPARLVILSIYCFLIWIVLFIYILLPPVWGYILALFPVCLIAYIVILYSSFGRLVIYSRAMQHSEIFRDDEDVHMSSKRIFEELLKKAEREKSKRSPLPLYYRSRTELHKHLSDLRIREQEEYVDMGFNSQHATHYVNRILDASTGHLDVPLSVILSPEEQREIPLDRSQHSTTHGTRNGTPGGNNGIEGGGGGGGLPQSTAEEDGENNAPTFEDVAKSFRENCSGLTSGGDDDDEEAMDGFFRPMDSESSRVSRHSSLGPGATTMSSGRLGVRRGQHSGARMKRVKDKDESSSRDMYLNTQGGSAAMVAFTG